MSREEWRSINGTEGRYEISNRGRARSALRGKRTILCGEVSNRGYLRFIMRFGKKWVKRSAHRLVLEAFVGPCPAGHQGAHLNGIKSRNWLSNLAWVPAKENIRQKRDHGTYLCGSRVPCAKLTETKVVEIKRRAALGASGRELAKEFGLHEGTVSKILLGKTWKHLPEILDSILDSNSRFGR